ncbi:MAG TPA: anthranilate synthase component I family protein [Candidatus Acidoferrales bacterium]|nr:anthranilate synthase component I family protein [Candidatus Acidoferrales bacterium]
MRPLIQEIATTHTPESLVENLRGENGVVLLRTSLFETPSARYSFVAASPFLNFRSFGSRCEITQTPDPRPQTQFGNPWHLLDALMARHELLDEIDSPFPLGGAFGYWGYDLKNFTEPKLPRRAVNDLELPDCHVGFYDSLVVFDHQLGKVSIISTGLNADGSRTEMRAKERLEHWKTRLHATGLESPVNPVVAELEKHAPQSNLTRTEFVTAVERAQQYISAGDIYQVNLSQRLSLPCASGGWEMFQKLSTVSPAPFSAFLDCDAGNGHGRFQIASSSPEQFLRMSGSHIVTRPIKGTRPRDADANRDAQLAYELQTSAKELAELVMITDLLRNDLGKVCEYGSVQTPDLARLEKFAQVQHLVSTVEGRLRKDVTHFAALASSFPGGSITGAPKFRAMEIIDELEPVSRGPYCGCIGYLGFNRESQLSITIRTAVCKDGAAHFNVGAGIVADSVAGAEYEETLAKAAGFLAVCDASYMKTAQLNDPPSTDTRNPAADYNCKS